ncbi:hypothetical protein EIN_080300, partial [Entamoeba invadens IP1]|uniref:hypothetical protein n=1 Tax=Entamoeba invadens IP1 TaxID=370355 RepID=UPI0002C3D3CE
DLSKHPQMTGQPPQSLQQQVHQTVQSNDTPKHSDFIQQIINSGFGKAQHSQQNASPLFQNKNSAALRKTPPAQKSEEKGVNSPQNVPQSQQLQIPQLAPIQQQEVSQQPQPSAPQQSPQKPIEDLKPTQSAPKPRNKSAFASARITSRPMQKTTEVHDTALQVLIMPCITESMSDAQKIVSLQRRVDALIAKAVEQDRLIFDLQKRNKDPNAPETPSQDDASEELTKKGFVGRPNRPKTTFLGRGRPPIPLAQPEEAN